MVLAAEFSSTGAASISSGVGSWTIDQMKSAKVSLQTAHPSLMTSDN